MSEDIIEALIDADEAAALLSVPKTWLYKAARNGTFPSVKVGRYVRFRPSDVRAWIASDGSSESPGLFDQGPVTAWQPGDIVTVQTIWGTEQGRVIGVTTENGYPMLMVDTSAGDRITISVARVKRVEP